MLSLLHRLPLGLLAIGGLLSMWSVEAVAETYNLVLERHVVNVTGRPAAAMLINGKLPGPLFALQGRRERHDQRHQPA